MSRKWNWPIDDDCNWDIDWNWDIDDEWPENFDKVLILSLLSIIAAATAGLTFAYYAAKKFLR